ncbi:MAG: endonuclease I family protein [Candidatus Rifleibacteriota bacterium]
MISKTYKSASLYLCLIAVVIALGALSVIAQEGNQKPDARKETLQQTLLLLDKIEADSPKSQADLVKLREKILALYRSPQIESRADEPDVNFARRNARTSRTSRNNRSRNEDWNGFYTSINNLNNTELISKIFEKIQRQKALDYTDARRYVMLTVDNYDNYIECIYTGKVISANTMPKNDVMNIEHSWPQSKGAKGIAKSDMHHLFPTDPVANSTRSSLPFGIVDHPSWEEGGSKCDGDVFQPRPKYRGNIARALFYFSVRYKYRIDSDEEQVLRQWNKDDPVDANERARNDRVEQIQGNRNPFVDHPELADRINDF